MKVNNIQPSQKKKLSSFNCPFCEHSFPLIGATYSCYESSFEFSDTHAWDIPPENCIRTNFYKCPNCGKISITLNGVNNDFSGIFINVYPNSLAKQFPDYIPKSIREDYEEAYSILNLSPKSSAALARRCLQGMIRDFHGIVKKRLIDEINALQDVIPASQWKAIDAIRSIGNIGAHMEKDVNIIIDVEPDEAEKLLKLIELLLDKWYIARHDEEQLFLDVANIANNKKSQKQSTQS